MIVFVVVPDGLPVRESRLVGRMPVRTDHRLVVVEVSLGGHAWRGWGSFPSPGSPPAGAGASMGLVC